jgi:hypothetical protein
MSMVLPVEQIDSCGIGGAVAGDQHFPCCSYADKGDRKGRGSKSMWARYRIPVFSGW